MGTEHGAPPGGAGADVPHPDAPHFTRPDAVCPEDLDHLLGEAGAEAGPQDHHVPAPPRTGSGALRRTRSVGQAPASSGTPQPPHGVARHHRDPIPRCGRWGGSIYPLIYHQAAPKSYQAEAGSLTHAAHAEPCSCLPPGGDPQGHRGLCPSPTPTPPRHPATPQLPTDPPGPHGPFLFLRKGRARPRTPPSGSRGRGVSRGGASLEPSPLSPLAAGT